MCVCVRACVEASSVHAAEAWTVAGTLNTDLITVIKRAESIQVGVLDQNTPDQAVTQLVINRQSF